MPAHRHCQDVERTERGAQQEQIHREQTRQARREQLSSPAPIGTDTLTGASTSTAKASSIAAAPVRRPARTAAATTPA